MSRTGVTNDFGVDAVLPADVGGAPSANRKHTKPRTHAGDLNQESTAR